jgi:hypothetical protein
VTTSSESWSFLTVPVPGGPVSTTHTESPRDQHLDVRAWHADVERAVLDEPRAELGERSMNARSASSGASNVACSSASASPSLSSPAATYWNSDLPPRTSWKLVTPPAGALLLADKSRNPRVVARHQIVRTPGNDRITSSFVTIGTR